MVGCIIIHNIQVYMMMLLQFVLIRKAVMFVSVMN